MPLIFSAPLSEDMILSCSNPSPSNLSPIYTIHLTNPVDVTSRINLVLSMWLSRVTRFASHQLKQPNERLQKMKIKKEITKLIVRKFLKNAWKLTLSILMSYIYGAPSKARNLTSYIYGRDFLLGILLLEPCI
jgi:hypothetical protein